MTYTAKVTLASPKVLKQLGGVGVAFGKIDVSDYSPTLFEIREITSLFKPATLQVILGGVSSKGFLVAWDSEAKAVRAWHPSPAHRHSLTPDDLQTNYCDSYAGEEVGSGVDVGEVSFVAFGLL